MAQILTSIAMYETLIRHGKTEEEAYQTVSEEMWKFLDPSSMQKLAKKSFFLPLIKKIVPFGFKKGSGYGWKYTWHTDDPEDEFRFECRECICQKILLERNILKPEPCAVQPTSSTTEIFPIPTSSAQKPYAMAAIAAISALSATIPTPAKAGSVITAFNIGGIL